MPYTVTARPDSAIAADVRIGYINAPVCRACIEDEGYIKSLFIWSHLREGQPVWWKFRVKLAWQILRGKVGLWERGQ